jgi:prepilin-type processing-associated H-X9-DG protein
MPPSRTASGGFPALSIPANAYNGAMIWLLPYIEQDNVHRLYNPFIHFGNTANRTAISTQVPVFNCPSTPSQPRFAASFTLSAVTINGVRVTFTPITTAAVGDYSVLRNVETSLWTTFPNRVDTYTEATRWGPFSYNSGSTIRVMRFSSIRDGLSNTISYVEDAGRPQIYVKGGAQLTGTVRGAGWADDAAEFGLHGCNPATGLDTRPGTQAVNCTNNGEPYGFHAGGCNVGMCDGSVRFISESIDIRIFARLVTAQAGEVIPGDF